ncbi:DNA translocase FtsK 4TM domain-containing protein [Limibacterium fermenti]|uniref:FtsK/SpoIIIE family DNA translocase n=1 Tax=Limibacterium fermenti TaxID=3229863 RepID=UPI003A6DBE7A
MKKKRVRRKANGKPRNQKKEWMEFLKNERVHFIFGVLLAFIGIFMLLAIISFFFTGAADQSAVLNKSFWELIRDKTLEVQNWTGVGGAFIAEYMVNGWFGIFSVIVPLFIMYLGMRLMDVSNLSFFKTLLSSALILIGGSIASAFVLGKLFPTSHINWGGVHGNRIEAFLESSIGWPGLLLLIVLCIVIIVVIFKKNSMYKMQETIIKGKSTFGNNPKEESFPEDEDAASEEEYSPEDAREKEPSFLQRLLKKTKAVFAHSPDKKIPEDEPQDESSFLPEKEEITPFAKEFEQKRRNMDNFEVIVPKDEEPVLEPESPEPMDETGSVEEDASLSSNPDDEPMEDYDPKKDLSSFRFPTMDLLKTYQTQNREVDMKEQNENKDKIIRTLRNYGIEITSIKATVGPTITLYEIVPQAGVRISRIRNLEDDIALSLSALGIRIIAPIPGKGTVGIEVPNKDPQIVSMQSVISSKKFQECTYDLPVALGKTITNDVFIFDLTKMPHLLVAGATGQGKSVGLNAIITSLLYKKHPSEMKMVLIDPKMVEFNIYSTIERHYLAKLPDAEKAIITDVSKVTQTLNSLTKEMDDRYELLMKAHVRTIKEYNDKFIKRRLNPKNGHRYLPYIVVVIDEFGDLIMTAGKEIEMPIARIAQKARAVGIHMVIATQRPTTNIITGTIKANFPARIAFRVTSQIDSRTILDMNGANQLIGRGDMLFSQGSNLIRIQCAFVDTPEVEEISQYIGQQQGYESAFALPEVDLPDGEEKVGSVDLNERDTLFDEAARLIVVHQQGSTSLIQRKFSIGYNRAGRLMDQLEAAGIVGPVQGSKPREVYISDEYSLEKLLDSLQ